jgi:hypothetical protein
MLEAKRSMHQEGKWAFAVNLLYGATSCETQGRIIKENQL